MLSISYNPSLQELYKCYVVCYPTLHELYDMLRGVLYIPIMYYSQLSKSFMISLCYQKILDPLLVKRIYIIKYLIVLPMGLL